MDILENLWNGRICPTEQTNDCNGEYQELMALLDRNEKSLLATLTPPQQEDLRRMEDLWEEMDYLAACAAFRKGFRLAVQLMAASF